MGKTKNERDADQRQRVGQVLGHGIASDRLVYGQCDVVTEGPESGECSIAAAAVVIVVRRQQTLRWSGHNIRRQQRDIDRGYGLRPPSAWDVGGGGKVVWRKRCACRGGGRSNDCDRGDHVDHQPYDYGDENDRETQEKDPGHGKHSASKRRTKRKLC